MVKIIGIVLLLILLVNAIEPSLHKKITGELKAEIQAIDYTSDQYGPERILCVDDNADALLWRLRMIGAAEEQIILSTFDFRSDESGTDVMSALYAAAQRGVKVQLLVDGIYQKLFLGNSKLFQALCAHENVEARFYNVPDEKNIWRLNYRMHDKYIIIDESMYLLGGRNTNDIFLGDYKKRNNVDREILVYETGAESGDSFHTLLNYFYEIWDEECIKNENVSKNSNWDQEYAILEQRYADLCEKYRSIENYDSWYEATIPASKITLIHNGTKAARKEPILLSCLEDLMSHGQDIVIQTPYTICNGTMYDILESVSNTADLKIIMNAVEKGSNPWGCTDYLNHKDTILETGATVYELMNEQAVHTKTILIDDNISIVGSYNLDMRSTYLDTELMLVIDCEALNAHIRQMCDGYMQKSIEVLPDGTETTGTAYESKEFTWQKQIYYGFLRIITIPFRHLL